METSILKLVEIGGPIAIVVFLFLYFIWRVSKEMIMPIATKMRDSIEANTKATIEMHEYLHLKNGQLEKCINNLSKAIKKKK
jgi:hypothetical protein